MSKFSDYVDSHVDPEDLTQRCGAAKRRYAPSSDMPCVVHRYFFLRRTTRWTPAFCWLRAMRGRGAAIRF